MKLTKTRQMKNVLAGLLALAPCLALPAAARGDGLRTAAPAPGTQASPASPAPPETSEVDRIVAAVIAAQGGREKLMAVHSRRETGRMSVAPDTEGPLVVLLARPGKMHMELTLHGQTMVRTYDGAAGWQINPFAGGTKAVALSPEEVTNISEEATFDGPLVDYHAQGNQVELAGSEPVEGQDAYKLKVTLKSGDVDYYYFDAASYRKVKWEGTRHQNGRPVTFETSFHDHRNVGGLTFPFRMDSGVKGEPAAAHIVLASIELNPATDEAGFGKPAAVSPPGAAVPPKP